MATGHLLSPVHNNNYTCHRYTGNPSDPCSQRLSKSFIYSLRKSLTWITLWLIIGGGTIYTIQSGISFIAFIMLCSTHGSCVLHSTHGVITTNTIVTLIQVFVQSTQIASHIHSPQRLSRTHLCKLLLDHCVVCALAITRLFVRSYEDNSAIYTQSNTQSYLYKSIICVLDNCVFVCVYIAPYIIFFLCIDTNGFLFLYGYHRLLAIQE